MTVNYSSIAAVVVHYESPESLLKTVENLSQYLSAEQIIVVDNSSSLRPEDLGNVILLNDGRNRGYAGGVNHGIRFVADNLTLVDEILVCTHEALFRDKALESLLTSASMYPHGHVVGPRLITADANGREIIWSNGGFFSLPFLYPKHDISPSARGMRRADWVDGAAFLIDLPTWKKLGGIPEEFFMYMEDVAVGELCRKLKIPVVVNLEAVVEQTANGPSRHLAIRNRILLAVRYMNFPRNAIVVLEVILRQAVMSLHPSKATRQKAAESRSAFSDAIKLISIARQTGNSATVVASID